MWQLFMWKAQGEIVKVGVYSDKFECQEIAKNMEMRAKYDIYFTWCPVGVKEDD